MTLTPSLLVAAGKDSLAFRRCVSLCGRLRLVRKKPEIKFLIWPRNGVRQSSSEFVGVRRGRICYVKMSLPKWKTGYKNAILLSACCFSMRFRGENLKTRVGNVWTSLRARLSSSEFASGLKFYRLRKDLYQKCHAYSFQGQIETGNSYCSAGPPGSVLCISADLIPYEPASSRKKPILKHPLRNSWLRRELTQAYATIFGVFSILEP